MCQGSMATSSFCRFFSGLFVPSCSLFFFLLLLLLLSLVSVCVCVCVSVRRVLLGVGVCVCVCVLCLCVCVFVFFLLVLLSRLLCVVYPDTVILRCGLWGEGACASVYWPRPPPTVVVGVWFVVVVFSVCVCVRGVGVCAF